MKKISGLLICLTLVIGSAKALSRDEVRAIILEAYPGAEITEIERERYKGKRIYEVDLRHGGEALEAIISLEGEIVHIEIDD